MENVNSENKNVILDKIKEEEKTLIYRQVIREINKKYRQEKREQIIERYHKDIPCCICGKMIDYTNMAKHKRSKRCMRIKQELENNQNQNNQNQNNQNENIINNQNEEYTDNDFSEEYISN